MQLPPPWLEVTTLALGSLAALLELQSLQFLSLCAAYYHDAAPRSTPRRVRPAGAARLRCPSCCCCLRHFLRRVKDSELGQQLCGELPCMFMPPLQKTGLHHIIIQCLFLPSSYSTGVCCGAT